MSFWQDEPLTEKTDFFLSTPTEVIAEILRMAVGTGGAAELKAVGRFARTCHRHKKIIETTPDIWQCADPGRVISSSWNPETTAKRMLTWKALQYCTKLTLFSTIPREMVVVLASAMPRLRLLDIARLLTPTDVPTLAQVAKKCPALETLRVLPNWESRYASLDPISRLTSLTTLDIAGPNTDDLLMAVSAMPPKLTSMSLMTATDMGPFFAKWRGRLTSLREISIPVKTYSHYGATFVVDLARAVPELRALRLTSPYMTQAGIMSVLSACQHLEELEFNVDGSLESLHAADFEGASCAGTLRKLIVSNAGIDVNIAPFCKSVCSAFRNLSELGLAGSSRVGDTTAESIAPMMSLQKLSFAPIHLTNSGLAALSAGFFSLRSLSVRSCPIDLSSFLASPRCSSLESLELIDCPITRQLGTELAKNASATLQTVTLCCDRGGVSLDFLVPLSESCSNISNVFLTIGSDTSNQAFGVLAPPSPVLHFSRMTITSSTLLPGTLAQIAPSFGGITDLTLACNKATTESVESIIKACPSIHFLTVIARLQRPPSDVPRHMTFFSAATAPKK